LFARLFRETSRIIKEQPQLLHFDVYEFDACFIFLETTASTLKLSLKNYNN